MNEYGLVSSDPPWKWVVEKPCFVSWNHKEEGPSSLGQLSPVNSTSKLTIHIGWRPETNELLIALHLPVSIRASRHPRDMFMIIPCDFDISRLDLSFAPVQADGRLDLESAGLADCNLFHVSFKLSKPCDVVMPQAKRQKPVKGTPKELMARLKSLSETSTFETYFRFDTFAQLELRKVFASASQYNTPRILLESMYDGRGGGFNLWLNQGLGVESVDALKLNIKKSDSYAGPSRQDIPPPPYTSDTIPSLDLNKPHVEVPFSDASVASVSIYKDSDVEGVPETPFWVRMRRIMDYRSPSVESPVRQGRFKRAASLGSLSEKDARLEKQICLFRSPTFGPMLQEASAPVPVVKTIADQQDVAIISRESSDDRLDDIARWLYTAWSVLPSAHHDLRTELLALGAAEDQPSFANLRVQCSTRLAFAAARAPKQASSSPAFTGISEAEAHVRETVRWINGVRADGDVALMRELIALAGAAMDVVESGVDVRAEKMEGFMMRKARCIASTCVLGRAVTTL
ncbi:hypothetical protein D6C81_03861 [Aureobasidium pullulans]|nr:hypothetical protein D6C81_03861 [Aureobasidium pullulans]